MMFKHCSKCGEAKPLEEFHKHRHAKDGRHSRCKPCKLADDRNWREKNRQRLSRQSVEYAAWARENPAAVATSHRRYREGNKDKIAASGAARRRANPALVRAAAKRFKQRYPEKAAAHRAVGEALRVGRLVRPNPCEKCSTPGQSFQDGRAAIQAHHPDYEKPLEVEWLCRSCHRARHSDGDDWRVAR